MLHIYSGQVRRFLTQFMRILNNFSVETGRGKDDQIALRPEINIAGIGVGLDLVVYMDNEGNVREDEWDFKNDPDI